MNEIHPLSLIKWMNDEYMPICTVHSDSHQFCLRYSSSAEAIYLIFFSEKQQTFRIWIRFHQIKLKLQNINMKQSAVTDVHQFAIMLLLFFSSVFQIQYSETNLQPWCGHVCGPVACCMPQPLCVFNCCPVNIKIFIESNQITSNTLTAPIRIVRVLQLCISRNNLIEHFG